MPYRINCPSVEDGFADGYDSVKRFVRRLGADQSAAISPDGNAAPGVQAQVDFGTGAPVVIPVNEPLPMGVKTRRRKTHIFRIVLSHSRKGYSEVVYRQTAEQFIRCLENAFWHFGGVPRTLVIDNLKAAVTRADWFDPDLNPRVRDFCGHYGTVNGTANHLEYHNFQDAVSEGFGGTKQAIPEEYKRRSAEHWPERYTMPWRLP